MTLTNLNNRASFSGNDVTTVFAWPYPVLEETDLVVVARVTATGVETVKTMTTSGNSADYSVDIADDELTANVTMAAAPATGTTLTIYRSPALTQELNLRDNDSLPSETVEASLDKFTMICQRVAEQIARAMVLKASDAPATLELPLLADRLSKYLAFDASGLPVAADAPTGTSITTAFTQTLLDDTTAAAFMSTLGMTAFAQTMLLGTLSVKSKTGTYTILSTDYLILCDSSGGAFTMTLPSAALNAGKSYVIKKTDTSLALPVTIQRGGSDTILDGVGAATSTTIDTVGETITLVSTGSVWVVTDRRIPQVTTSWTPTLSWVSGITSTAAKWVRRGKFLRGSVFITCSGNVTATPLTATLPTGLLIDTAALASATSTGNFELGVGTCFDAGVNSYMGCQVSYSTTSVVGLVSPAVSGAVIISAAVKNDVPFTFAASDLVNFVFEVPISGWNG